MDVIDASHFEQIKKFMLERPWWELKINRNGTWNIFLINSNDSGPFGVMPFIHPTLGGALRLASKWVGEQFALQIRETEAVSIRETSSDSETLDKEVRKQDNAEEKCHCGLPVHYYEEMNNFTRGLCLECSTVRCDLGGLCPVAVNK